MKEIDYFDQQLLGYLQVHPNSLFRDAARALGVHTLVVDHRVQKLLDMGLLTMEPQGAFQLTEEALAVRAWFSVQAAEAPSLSEFSWEDLYIPLKLT